MKNKKVPILITVVCLIALAGAGLTVKHLRHHAVTTMTDPTPHETINFGPTTDEEKQQTEEHKQDLSSKLDTQANQQPQSGKKSVTPTISGADLYNNQYIVSAFVSGIYESGGTCTVTGTLGSQTVTKQTSAEKDATTTRCDNFIFSRGEFPSSGSWSIKVTYDSPTATGQSTSQILEVK